MPLYFELHLAETRNTLPRIIDITPSWIGEPLSVYLARLYIPPSESWEKLGQLRAPTTADFLHAKGPLGQLLCELWAPDRWTEFEDYFERYRSQLDPERAAHVARLGLAAIVSDTHALTRAYESYERRFPGDPSLPYWKFKEQWQQGRWDGALETIDAIDREVADPFLQVLRARLHFDAGRLTQAEACAKKGTDLEPSLAEGWYVRVAIRLSTGGLDSVSELLSTADQVSDLELKRIRALSGFERFAQTDAGRAWISSRSGR
jgi:tetratricopeptide (TPR) repeat protein